MNATPLHFFIITPTCKRPELLKKVLASVKKQDYANYTHLIINDSGGNSAGYEFMEQLDSSGKTVYFKNESNLGKNKSLNVLLASVSNRKEQGYVVFLDDDDWFTDHALSDIASVVQKKGTLPWIVSKRSYEGGKDVTKSYTGKELISYRLDYLLLKKFTGDATHFIEKNLATKIAFPECFKNGEEWLYFSEVEKYSNSFYFLPSVGTVTSGYLGDGITLKYTMPSFSLLLSEILKRKIYYMEVILYLFGRTLKNKLKTRS